MERYPRLICQLEQVNEPIEVKLKALAERLSTRPDIATCNESQRSLGMVRKLHREVADHT
jgi:hypothetical protein